MFERCFTETRAMAFDYRDSAGRPSSRRIECIGLLLHPPVWYILAWDLDKDASRLFRMDRILAPSCGEVLTAQHALGDVVVEVEPALDRWRRRAIG